MTNTRSELPPNDEVDGVGERGCRLRQRVRGLDANSVRECLLAWNMFTFTQLHSL